MCQKDHQLLTATSSLAHHSTIWPGGKDKSTNFSCNIAITVRSTGHLCRERLRCCHGWSPRNGHTCGIGRIQSISLTASCRTWSVPPIFCQLHSFRGLDCQGRWPWANARLLHSNVVLSRKIGIDSPCESIV